MLIYINGVMITEIASLFKLTSLFKAFIRGLIFKYSVVLPALEMVCHFLLTIPYIKVTETRIVLNFNIKVFSTKIVLITTNCKRE